MWQELSVVWYGIFWVTKISLYALDIVLDFLTGYSIMMGSRAERLQSQDYSHSAHLVRVVSRGGFSTILDHEAHNFLWLHQSYLHPENILLDKNVVMYAMTKTHAYFTISTEDLYDVEVSCSSSLCETNLYNSLFTEVSIHIHSAIQQSKTAFDCASLGTPPIGR